jgi:hypothetical protein
MDKLYYCNYCKRYFEEPREIMEPFDHEFGISYLYSYECPYCSSQDFIEKEECECETDL